MIAMYCRDHHEAIPRDARGHCASCAELFGYAERRLGACRYGVGKPTCANCATHCYAPTLRERVRAVMRYSGPRMPREHPVLSFWHVLDGRRETPPPGTPSARQSASDSKREV